MFHPSTRDVAPFACHRVASHARFIEQACRLRDGSAALWRQVRADDAAALEAMLSRQSAASRYLRFHAVVNHLSDAELARMTRSDDPLQFGLVLALDRPLRPPCLIAEARFARDDDEGERAEIALIVDEAWQREGLARQALRLLAQAARAAGLRALHGRVLDTNLAMLALVRHAGWALTRDADDGRVRCFRIELGSGR